MNNAPYDGNRPNVALISALTARYTIPEMYSLAGKQEAARVYYYPGGKSARAKVWVGIPDKPLIELCRRMLGIARGREESPRPEDQGPPAWLGRHNAKADRDLHAEQAPLCGQMRDGFDRIITFKWTTDGSTKRRIPPNTLVWRDLHSGKIYRVHPEDEAQTA